MSQHPAPVFIVGHGRSGTTITATLLNHLPGIHIVKETGYIGLKMNLLQDIRNPSTLSRLIEETNAWLTYNHWENTASLEGFRQFCSRYGIHGGGAFIHYVWQLDSPTPWHELSSIGDNTPLYVMAIPAILELMPDARFIHMVRDPRDVICSTLKMRFGADEIVTAAMEWHLYLGCWLMAERVVPAEQRIECRYEDLCLNPMQSFARLAKFLNRSEQEAAAALALHASGDSTHKTGFEKIAAVSHHTRLTEPLNGSRIGRYKSEFSASQIQQIEEIAQYGMAACGYAVSTWQVHPLMREDRIKLTKAAIRDTFIRCMKRLRGR